MSEDEERKFRIIALVPVGDMDDARLKAEVAKRRFGEPAMPFQPGMKYECCHKVGGRLYMLIYESYDGQTGPLPEDVEKALDKVWEPSYEELYEFAKSLLKEVAERCPELLRSCSGSR